MVNYFNKNKLENLIHDKVTNHVGGAFNLPQKLEELDDELENALQGSVDYFFWTLEHFLSLIAGFSFQPKLFEKRQEIKPDPYNPTCQIVTQRVLDENDLIKTAQEVILFYSEMFAILTDLAKEKGISDEAKPIVWLELAEKYSYDINKRYVEATKLTFSYKLVPKEMKELIRYTYFGLDEKRAKEGIFPVLRYSLKEAAQVLCTNEDNVIAECFKNDFGVYLREGLLKNGGELTVKKYSSSMMVEEINNSADFNYKYFYKGHVRLSKRQAGYPSEVTLEEIYRGGEIRVLSNHDYRLIPLQTSVAEYSSELSLSIDLRRGQKITREDLVFIQDEIHEYKNNKTFDRKLDWQNFYSEKNARIIEELIDRYAITIDELTIILFPRARHFNAGAKDFDPKKSTAPEEIIKSFNATFTIWHENPEIYTYEFDKILVNAGDRDKIVRGTTLLRPEIAISLLINNKLLPWELDRLPREAENKRNFKINPDYYSECADFFYKHPDEIIKFSSNCSDKWPKIVTYEELKDNCQQKGLNEDEIWQALFSNALGAYLKASESNIKTHRTHNTCLSINRKLNCGNPFYLTRYAGLERLVVNEDDSHISLKKLRINESIPLRYSKKRRIVLETYLQTTDLESKFHIQRTLQSFNGKDEIKIRDLVFLEGEVKQFLSRETKKEAIAVLSSHELFDAPRETKRKKSKTTLQEIIEQLYLSSPDKSPMSIWKQLKKLAEDDDEIIQEVDSWTTVNAEIRWQNHTGKENKTGKRRFQNIISTLNNLPQ